MGIWWSVRAFVASLSKVNSERCGNRRTPERVKDDWLFESLFFDVF